MISKPGCGWSFICFDENKSTELRLPLSYIQPIPKYLLEEFIEGLSSDYSSIVLDIDTEGNSFKIITDFYRTYVINEGMNQLYCFDLDKFEFIKTCIKDFERDLVEWASFDVFKETEDEYKNAVTNNYDELLKQIKMVKDLLKGRE